jgi:2-polyprenyl-3-methyl-5-hydroxy-6-metoxy-1,4-benzoquinol methylase
MDFNSKGVFQNEHGFYEVAHKPSQSELSKYYKNKYFETCSSYKNAQIDWEVKAKKIEAEIILYALKSLDVKPPTTLFEIGFGEGFLLAAAKSAGYRIQGSDFSKSQILEVNNSILEHTRESASPINDLLSNRGEINVVCMKHVLEHVRDPETVITKIASSLTAGGMLVIEIPNDFSLLQKHLMEIQKINDPYWVCPPDHLSYFTEESLISFVTRHGFIHSASLGSFPIEILLLGEALNYKNNPRLGKSAHQVRCLFNAFIFDKLGIEHLHGLYSNKAILSVSRSITSIFTKT